MNPPPGTPPGTGKVVWVGPATDAPLVLPAGTYTVKAEYGRARQERTATAAVGTLAALEIPLDAGRLKLRTIDREGGGEVDRVAYVVSEDDPDSKQGRRVVARSAAVMPDLTLPAGTYYVSARRGAAEARDRVLLGAVVLLTLVVFGSRFLRTWNDAGRQTNGLLVENHGTRRAWPKSMTGRPERPPVARHSRAMA